MLSFSNFIDSLALMSSMIFVTISEVVNFFRNVSGMSGTDVLVSNVTYSLVCESNCGFITVAIQYNVI